jgi:hypothetical protein
MLVGVTDGGSVGTGFVGAFVGAAVGVVQVFGACGSSQLSPVQVLPGGQTHS